MTSPVPDVSTEDFSSNAHTPHLDSVPSSHSVKDSTNPVVEAAVFQVPSRHPDLCFDDGSIAVLCGHLYFLVHQSVLTLHSPLLGELVDTITDDADADLMEGRPTLRLPESPNDMFIFLRALYGLCPDNDMENFSVASTLMRLATIYQAEGLRKDVLLKMLLSWPMTLKQWEKREKSVTTADGVYAPRPSLPHPAFIISLAREVDAPQLLPSAFYDLSRYLPSQLATGCTDQETGQVHQLSAEDLFRVFRGKEQAARYLSTFIVKELEGRTPSEWCHYRQDMQPARKRRCQVAFEAVTYSLIRDVNGLVMNRNSDPLFAIADSLLMQTKDDAPGLDNRAAVRACEACRLEYGAVVEAIREEFWRRLPEWFELDVPDWA